MTGRKQYYGSARAFYTQWERRYEKDILYAALGRAEGAAALSLLENEINVLVSRYEAERARYGRMLQVFGIATIIAAALGFWQHSFAWISLGTITALVVTLLLWKNCDGVIVAAKDFDRRFFGFYTNL